MEISSDDGAWLRMWPVGYQPGIDPPTGSNMDGWEDWLVIAVSAGTADGKDWSFRNPCLTTDEAGALGEWLRSPESALRFTEPNLTFRAAHRTLVVDFSYESLPPWMPGSGLSRTYPLKLAAPAAVLARAADRWAAEIAEFPRRPAFRAGLRTPPTGPC